jgi:nucleoid-associated protein YgaU
MRKDLKIGMAIGAVLLAVVVVYLAIKPDGTEVAGAGEGTSAAESMAAVDPEAMPAESGVPQDGSSAAEPQPAGPVVAEAAPNRPDPFAPASDSPASEDAEEPAPADGEGTNWAKLLDTGGDLAPLRTTTPLAPERGGGSIVTPVAGAREVSVTATGEPAAVIPAETGGATAAPSAPAAATGTAGASALPVEREPATPAPTTPAAPEAPSSSVAARIPGEAEAAGGRTHVMKKDETYSSIAKMLYGHSRHYLDIEKANPGLDPKRIRPGTVINLPDPATIKAPAVASATVAGTVNAPANTPAAGAATAEVRAIDPKTEYEVKPNDSLHKIATSVYGTSTMWEKIYELNQQTIGPDAAKLKLGMVLKLPPNPAEAQGGAAGAAATGSGESASRSCGSRLPRVLPMNVTPPVARLA